MSGVRLEIRIDDGGLGRAMRRAIERAEDLKPILEESATTVIEANIQDRFDRGRGPGGIPWPPSGRVRHEARPGGINKDGTRGKSKKALNKIGPNHGGKTLVDKGHLRSSIDHATRETEVEVGVATPARGDAERYAAIHQFGGTITPKKEGGALVFTGADGQLVFASSVTIPARPYIGFDDQDVADLEALWTDAVKETFDGG